MTVTDIGNRPRRTHMPLIVALFLLAVTIAGEVRIAMGLTDQHLVYALDDAYIHLAMGRTLAESGVWGIRSSHPAFASSSPGWTLLLAACHRLGFSSEWVPLGLNVLAAMTLVLVVNATATRLLRSDTARLWLLVIVVFATPVPALVLGGMETLWFVAVTAAFVARAALESSEKSLDVRRPRAWALLLLAGLMVSLRYEGLFVAGAAAVLLAWRRNQRLAAGVVVAALVPVGAYALYAVMHGGDWLPASVLLKGGLPAFNASGLFAFLTTRGFFQLGIHGPLAPILVAMLLLAGVLAWPRGSGATEQEAWLAIATLAAVAHVYLVRIEWLYRYRAYVVVIGMMAVAFGLSRVMSSFPERIADLRERRVPALAAALLACSLAGPVLGYAMEALPAGIRGSRSIYLQQYQMASFLEAEGTSPVALNDIGAVAYFTRRPIVDLAGLADQEIARERREGTFDTEAIERAASRAGVHVAVIYERWFEGPLALPAEWVRVGRWTSDEHLTAAEPTVSIFATRGSDADRLRLVMESWTPRLPRGVTVSLDPPHRSVGESGRPAWRGGP